MSTKGTYTVKFYLDTDLDEDTFVDKLHDAVVESDLPCQMWVVL